MARIFVRVVDDDGMTVDMVGRVEQVVLHEEKQHDPFSYRGIASYRPRRWLAELLPHLFDVTAWRISEPEAVINWNVETIPEPEMLILGDGKAQIGSGS